MTEPNLSDEHVLDFRKEHVSLPVWFEKRKDLRIMFASGDWIQGGIPNTQTFSEYDIHACYPVNEEFFSPMAGNGPDFESNVQYIRKNFYHSRLICILDIQNRTQMERFITVFENKVAEVNTLDPRIYPFACKNVALMAEEILQPGGVIMRPMQCAENLVQYDFVCEHRKCTKKSKGGKRTRNKQRRRTIKK